MARFRSPLWLSLLGVYAVAGAVFLFLPATPQAVLNTALGLLSVVAIGYGARHNRTAVRWPWYLMATGMALFVAGDFLFWMLSTRGVDTFPSSADIFYLAAYPALTASMLGLIRARRPGKDRPGLLDALVVSTGAAMLTWVFVLEPMAAEVEMNTTDGAIYLAYPVADLLLLTLLARLSTGRGDRPMAFRLVVAGTLALLAGDIAYMAADINLGYDAGGPLDLCWIVMYGLLGAAALHPSAAAICRPVASIAEGTITRGRVVALALASLMAPAALIIEYLRDPEHINVPVIVAGCVVLFLLVIARLQGLVALLSTTLHAVEEQATTDQLTGLANRRLFHTRWQHALADTVGPTALLYLDLDGFKPVNDALGHEAGDAVLVGVADRLRSIVRAGDVVARLGGDEFAIILPWTDDATAESVAQRIVATLAQPFDAGGRTVFVGASVGVVLAAQGNDPNGVLRQADSAMYAAKQAGRGCVHVAR